MMSAELTGEPDQAELEWETHKWLTVDALALSVNTGYLERDKAVELAEIWFEDRNIIVGLYRAIENGKKADTRT